MSDLPDVLDALAGLALGVFYPTPPAQGNSPVTNTPVKIYPGWPVPDQLNSDLSAANGGIPTINISIFAVPGAFENVTRYPEDWKPLAPIPAPTITVTISGVTATIGGTVSSPQNVALIVDRKPYVYAVQSTDTLTSIAAALAALVAADQQASASGAVVTIPYCHSLVGRVGIVATAVQEVMRVRQRFMISFWCPTPALRNLASTPVRLQIALTKFLTLPDGFAARLLLVGDAFSDQQEKLLIYRRDLIVTVEYATTNTDKVFQIIVPEAQISSSTCEQTLGTESGGSLVTESGEPIALEDPTFLKIDY